MDAGKSVSGIAGHSYFVNQSVEGNKCQKAESRVLTQVIIHVLIVILRAVR